ncbi:hypothetical protein [Methylobacter sp. S3L5C]|nr:hypothetical protein [Methylobacter sp. S3L5C]UOA07807.1 hypothetical protein KKZ03_16340 [Methylobacter sp. S3L5C]
MSRKCDLLKEINRNLFWDRINEALAALALAQVIRRNRRTAKELERRGVL